MPLPSPTLYPGVDIYPGDLSYAPLPSPTGFINQVLEAVSPWNDPSGFWVAYNTALASMFEPVYDIVADTGDVGETVVASLNATIVTGAPIYALPVQAVSQALAAGTSLTLGYAQNSQTFTVTTAASPGDTTIAVEGVFPNYPYPSGTPVALAYIPGWSTLLDPNNCPDQFLPFLAEFNGTTVPVGLDPTAARQKILNESGLQRGTAGAIISAVQRNLIGSQSVTLIERVNDAGDPDAYFFIVIVRPEQVVSEQAVADAIHAIKPGGVMFHLILTDGWIISQMELSQATLGALETNFATLTGLENDRPGT